MTAAGVGLSGLWLAPGAVRAQASAPHESGTVKSTDADGVVLTTTAGQDVTVKVPQAAKVLVVAPGSRDLKSATPGALSDIAPGDRMLVTGVPGETGSPMTAARVILMKSSAIAQSHASEEAAWQAGGGGIVKSVDPAAGTVTIVNGARVTVVKTTPATTIRRYAGTSVRFQDAAASSLAAVQPGDQLRVRGSKSADGSEITADAIVTGRFEHYAGLISSVNPAANTLTLKDLATKKNVTVKIAPNTNVRRMPERAAEMFAHRGGQAGESPRGEAGGRGPGASGARASGARTPGSPEGAGRMGARPELSQMLQRFPQETLAGLKPDEAVMVVATGAAPGSDQATAITVLAGVEPLLTSGTAPELSPWSVGSGMPDESGGESAPQ